MYRGQLRQLVRFQSTHPVRGATADSSISAHWRCIFQSTHPVRGATGFDGENAILAIISIHAPREGCDEVTGVSIGDIVIFQSTHPVRGATVQCVSNHHVLIYFNPRTP